jgi:hypothetical protein
MGLRDVVLFAIACMVGTRWDRTLVELIHDGQESAAPV